MEIRPTWDEYFMNITDQVKDRSTCLRRQFGAVIVRDKQILSTGYNGAPAGCTHCTDKGSCLRQELGVPSGEKHELCRAAHAEQNAICQAAKHGISTDKATIYVGGQPCSICAKMIINAGIKRVVYRVNYPDAQSLKFLSEAGIEVCKMPEK